MLEAIYLISRARITGPTNQALNILKGMKMNGEVNMTLVTLLPELERDSRLNDFVVNGINVVQLMPQKSNVWKSISLLNDYIKNNNIDVVHSTGYQADFVNGMLSVKVKKVTTQRCHPKEIAEKKPKFMRPFLEWGHLKIIKRLDEIVACSLSLQNVFKDEFGMKILAVQNGVDTNRFFPLPVAEKEHLREQLGIEKGKRVFLVLGSLSARKNVGIIIQAFQHSKINNYKLLIVGPGPERQALEKMTEGNSDIIFTGITSTPLKYLQAADILVSSSLNEGLPNTVLEAMACGLPTILSDIGPHIELIDQPFLGLIFKKKEEYSLIDALETSQAWEIESMRGKIRKYAEDNHSIQSLARKYNEIYKR